jgi:phospholipid/cholesterol/gamma-HCH transport system permease protein
MGSTAAWPVVIAELVRSALTWFAGWWRIVLFGAKVLALALSPSSYRAENRRAVARQLVDDSGGVLLWFTVLSALLSVVIIHIVVVTAVSYGLSRYALEMVVRVLVLELIPLTAAVFVTLYCALPDALAVAALRARGGFDRLAAEGVDPLQREVLPRVVGSLFAVLLLATVACVVTAVIAYLSVYGATWGGFPAYTRTFGHVFNPAVSLIFALKTLAFAAAVGLLPIASVLHDRAPRRLRGSAEMRGLVRLFFVLLLIEAASLIGNYY